MPGRIRAHLYWTVRRMTYSEQGLGELRDTPGRKAEGLRLRCICSLECCYDVMPPVLNIYTPFIRHACSCWVSDHSHRTQSGKNMLSAVLGAPDWVWPLPRLCAFPDIIYGTCQALFKLLCPEKVLGIGCYVDSLCLLAFIYMFSEHKHPSLDHCFLCYISV